MKKQLAITVVVVAALALSTFSAFSSPKPAQAQTASWNLDAYGPRSSDNMILKWNEILLEAVRKHPAQTGPTIVARALGILHTATFDAWAAYDAKAKGTTFGSTLRRPTFERTLPNKEKAISYAAYRVLTDLFPPGAPPLHPHIGSSPGQVNFASLMASKGYDPSDTTQDTTKPEGIGNKVAAALLADRHHDGSNQLGDEPARTTPDPKKRYSNYVTYTPANKWENVTDWWRWQPLCTLTLDGIKEGKPMPSPNSPCPGPPYYALQNPLGPHWKNVKMFGNLQASQFRVTGPPRNPDGSFSTTDIDNEISFAANLDNAKKAKAEYWADGPASVFPPGHDFIFAQALSRRRNLSPAASLDADAKLFFMLGNAMMDASIACWFQKYRYDFVRPITAIRYNPNYKDKPVPTWLGPNNGFSQPPHPTGSNWLPYQALHVVTPPFPEYPSGHSTFSGAGSTILSSFFGEAFGAYVVIKQGTLAFESNTPTADVTLSWPTFTHASNEAGDSRRWGGIHFFTGDNHGRALGRQVAQYVFSKANSYITGTIPG
jgi:PAP2 superfamily/Vanadium chloroperoxidase N-terminal domain